MKSILNSSKFRVAVAAMMLTVGVLSVAAPAGAAVSKATNQFYIIGQSSPVPGIQVSGYDGKTVYASIASVRGGGTVAVSATTGLTLPFGYSSYSGERIAFTGSQTDVNNALKTLTFTPESETKNVVTLRTAFFENNPDYAFLPKNMSFYRAVRYPAGATAAEKSHAVAAAAAKTTTWAGITGYLANITTPEENEFVERAIGGARNVWIGGSDETTEGTWVFTDGPEKGTRFWSGNCTSVDGTAVTGAFTKWATGEPNNWIDARNKCGGDQYNRDAAAGEDCIVTNWSEGTPTERDGFWNDVPCDLTTSAYTAARVQGYLIEYGPSTGATFDFAEHVLYPKAPAPKPLTLNQKISRFLSGAFTTLKKAPIFSKKQTKNGKQQQVECPDIGRTVRVRYSITLGEAGRYSLYFTAPSSGRRAPFECGSSLTVPSGTRRITSATSTPVVQTTKANEQVTIDAVLKRELVGSREPQISVVLRRTDGVFLIDQSVQIRHLPLETKKRR